MQTCFQEQEEKEKKGAERKEAMEARRLAASQKKVEGDRVRQLEHERKVKEEIERRKREREEMNASKLGTKAKKVRGSIAVNHCLAHADFSLSALGG